MDSTSIVAIVAIVALSLSLSVIVVVAIVYGFRKIKGSLKDGDFDLEK